jgi:hypothetical protein
MIYSIPLEPYNIMEYQHQTVISYRLHQAILSIPVRPKLPPSWINAHIPKKEPMYNDNIWA